MLARCSHCHTELLARGSPAPQVSATCAGGAFAASCLEASARRGGSQAAAGSNCAAEVGCIPSAWRVPCFASLQALAQLKCQQKKCQFWPRET